jgi:ferritin
MMTMMTQKNAENFICEKCDFVCSKKSNYEKHLLTRKHKNDDKKEQKNAEQNVCICGKSFKYRQGLCVHRKTCIDYEKNVTTDGFILETEINKKIDSTTDKDLKELVKELIKQNGELVKTINDIVPKIGNTNITNNNNNNNNFNLNVFLNEQCKDALNISDFIDSLKITLEDLLFSKTNGISRGITDVMIKGLKELDIHKRPIHCTDIKRDIMYIKNEDNWSKDDNHQIMKNTIVKIADKERTALQQWAIDNPDWIETERKQLEYLTMMRSICEPIENYNNYEKKIIKILSKEIQVDKKVNNE